MNRILPDPHHLQAASADAFHPGEQAIQARFGVRHRLAETGRRTIRPFMPDQHREFFTRLPYLLIGGGDPDGRVWASILFGRPGFVAAPDAGTLRIDAWPSPGDPLAETLRPGSAAAVLGIDLATRRRNRANGRLLAARRDAGLVMAVRQSFGNCPQYIWPRSAGEAFTTAPAGSEAAERTSLDDERVRSLIGRADTFFIASRHGTNGEGAADGVDVSHRGGSPGFLGMEDGALVWPEYRGNYYFNTLGNLALDRACGLIIPDFETGDLLQMTGSAEILWPEAGGAEADGNLQVNCRVRFTPSGTVLRPRAMPGGWSLLGGAQAAGGPLPRRRGDG